jgi:hypothetical protein
LNGLHLYYRSAPNRFGSLVVVHSFQPRIRGLSARAGFALMQLDAVFPLGIFICVHLR